MVSGGRKATFLLLKFKIKRTPVSVLFNGGCGGGRTHDQLIKSQLRYHCATHPCVYSIFCDCGSFCATFLSLKLTFSQFNLGRVPHTHVFIQFFVIVVAPALPSYLKTILNYFYLGLLLHSDKSLISLSLSFALSSLLRAGFALLTRRPTQNPLGRVPHTHVFIQFFLLNYSSIKNNNCTTKIKGDKFVA